MASNGRVAVIGDKDSVLAFKALGVEVFFHTQVFSVRECIKKLAQENYSLIFICEKQAEMAQDMIDRYKDLPYPVIIPIPDSSGSNGYGIKCVKKDIEKAVGADINFRN